MTISSEAIRAQANGDGATISFPFGMPITSSSSIRVIKTVIATDVETEQSDPTHYSVTLTGSPAGSTGGSVNFVTPPLSTERVSIVLDTPLRQDTSLPLAGDFLSTAVEQVLDKGVTIAKRNRDLADRSLTLQDGDVDGSGIYNANSNRITNLAAPVDGNDAATKNSVDASITSASLAPLTSVVSALGSGYTIDLYRYQTDDTGATDADLNTRLAQTKSVTDFGATGDGSTDDTVAIQAAVDSGGWIFVPPGTYMLDQVDVTDEVHLVLDPSAILKQRSSGDEDIALIRFTTGSDRSTLEGGQFDGDAGTLAASYTGSTETNKRVWCGIRVDGAVDHISIRRVQMYDFMMAGFWHQNGQYVVWEDIHIARCGKGFICQSNDYGQIRNVTCEDVQNRSKAIFQHAVEIRDATGLTVNGITVVDYQPDNSGVEPTPTAIAIERMTALSATGLICTGFSGSGKPGQGFAFDTLSHSSISGLVCRDGYEQGSTINSCSNSSVESFTFDFNRLLPLGGDGIGLRVRPGGLYPPVSAGEVSENARANEGCRNLRIANGIVIGAGSTGYTIQSGDVTLAQCEAIGSVDHGFYINENLANSLFSGSTAPRAENIRLDSCAARYNGQTGLLIEDGRLIAVEGGDYSNNGQSTSASTNARSGIRITNATDVRLNNVLVDDTQDWSTKTDGASFQPGATVSERYEVTLVDPDQINVGQALTLTDAGGSGVHATAIVVDKVLDEITAQVSGGFTFSSSGNLTALTGTFDTSTYVLTGTGTALDTEVVGRTWATDGASYRRIIRVNSATSGVTESYPADLATDTLSKLTVNVSPIVSQQYGVRVESSSTGVVGSGVIGDGNASILWSVADPAALKRVGSSGNERPSVASAASLSVAHDVHHALVTGTTSITSISASYAGKILVLEFAAALTVTDGSNLKLAGNFVTTADDIITLISDGTNWVEISRSVN